MTSKRVTYKLTLSFVADDPLLAQWSDGNGRPDKTALKLRLLELLQRGDFVIKALRRQDRKDGRVAVAIDVEALIG